MEVILLERIDRLGQMGDVVNVKNGYARNYLLPQKKALRSTKENMAYFESKRAELEAHNLKLREDAVRAAESIKTVSLSLVRQAAESGMLYGSVSARDIFEALRDMNVKVERHQIDLPQPIKNVGVYDVRIVLHPDVSENIKVTVARSGEEANKLAASYNSDLVKPVEETNEEVVVAETQETVEA
ncbi:MAG: 50S ribosomal protein L9 [Alphaproteobacteria bacterium]|nr:50S ribosomal protein L9 [Alphaproteobacteria bacterium]